MSRCALGLPCAARQALRFFGSADLCGSGGSAVSLLDCVEDHRRGAVD